MNFSEAKKSVYTGLTNILKPHGFKYISKASAFIKYNQNGYWALYAPLIDYSPLFNLRFAFSIRLNSVEETYNKFGNIIPPYQSFSSTCLIKYDYFKDKKKFTYNFYNHEELNLALSDFTEVLSQAIFPFLESLSKLERLGELVGNMEIANIDTLDSPDNFIHWIIIAKLCNLDDFGWVTNSLLDYLQKTGIEEEKKRILEFLKYLDITRF